MNYFFKKEPVRGYICSENILTIRPARAIKKHDFQKTAEPASRSTETNAIIETKRSIITFMAAPEKKKGKAPLRNRMKEEEPSKWDMVLTGGRCSIRKRRN
jgi:hypothetical protein